MMVLPWPIHVEGTVAPRAGMSQRHARTALTTTQARLTRCGRRVSASNRMLGHGITRFNALWIQPNQSYSASWCQTRTTSSPTPSSAARRLGRLKWYRCRGTSRWSPVPVEESRLEPSAVGHGCHESLPRNQHLREIGQRPGRISEILQAVPERHAARAAREVSSPSRRPRSPGRGTGSDRSLRCRGPSNRPVSFPAGSCHRHSRCQRGCSVSCLRQPARSPACAARYSIAA